jgi:hypothetical protein
VKYTYYILQNVWIKLVSKETTALITGQFDVHVAVHRDKFLITEPTRCTNFSKFFYFGVKLYMFRTVSLSITRSFSLYTRQWYMSYRFVDSLRAGSMRELQFHPDPARKLSANLYDIYHCRVYSEKLLMMDRGTVRNI